MRHLVILVALLAACNTPVDHGHQHDDNGHDHAGDSRPTMDHTVRSEGIELYLKYPALVVGLTSSFEAYLTQLEDYRPNLALEVTVSLIKGDMGIRNSDTTPNSNGVYHQALRPKEPGPHRLKVGLRSSELNQTIDLGDVMVYSNLAEVQSIAEHSTASEITFQKKQAWEIDFQTDEVLEQPVYQVIYTSGIWKAAPGDYKALTANSNGIVNFNQDHLTEGTRVKKGQPIMTITSKGLITDNLEVEIQKATADHNQISAEYERQKTLYEAKLISKAEFEKSESRYLVSKASLESLKQGYKAGGKQIIVPFDGFVKSIEVENGDYVVQGAHLFTVVSLHSQLLETQVSLTDDFSPDEIADIWFRPPSGKWYSMKESGGSVLSVGREVSLERPSIPIFAKFNSPVDMPQGSYTEVQIAIGDGTAAMVIPESALMEDYGNYSVIVQLGGERFQKRSVSIGKRNGSLVEVINGLKTGEIVVTKGVYQVKMASLSSSIPSHGHEH